MFVVSNILPLLPFCAVVLFAPNLARETKAFSPAVSPSDRLHPRLLPSFGKDIILLGQGKARGFPIPPLAALRMRGL